MKKIIDFLNKDFFKFTLKENILIEKDKEEYSGFFRRFGAILVDLAVFSLLMIFLIKTNLLSYSNSFVLFLIFPLVNTISLYFYGMTLGKYVFGIKIRNEEGAKNDFFALLKREYILKPISMIFFGFGIWRMFIDPKKQTYYDKRTKIEVIVWRSSWIDSLFIFAMVFSLVFEVVKPNMQSNSGHYTDINKTKTRTAQTNNLPPVLTPTIYQCPVTNSKTDEDIKMENAEKNLSSYNYFDNIINPEPNKDPLRKKITVNILEKILLPCNKYDENYCQISNKDLWTIKYPKEWQLYRIRRRGTDEYSSFDYYDLKFEYLQSYFYLKEIVTLGGQPIIISNKNWFNLKVNCQDAFFVNSQKQENYICAGNVSNCAGNMEGDQTRIYFINNYYKSFVTTNSSVQNEETLIYDWYIPSISIESQNQNRGLRAYVFSENFYSNDEKFISELKKIYTTLVKMNK